MTSCQSIVFIDMSRAGEAAELDVQARQAGCGLVFQFPERHFLGYDILSELLLTAPRFLTQESGEEYTRQMRMLPVALRAVDMEHVDLGMDPNALSDGYKRRLALAVQLMRQPALLLLDEPLAGVHTD
jgi:energy-coupling factor transporter ATP-binding protein EcfA2